MFDLILEAYQVLLFPMAMWALFWYLISLLIKRNDFVDVAWGLGFLYIIYWLAHEYELGGFQTLLYVLVAAWGLRLSVYLFWRNISKSEDIRYAQWRKDWMNHLWWRSFLQIYVLQNIFMLVIAFPLVLIATMGKVELSFWVIPGVLLWIVGMYWETIADWQKSRFKLDPDNKGKLLTSGLWALSRHPNYFGEIGVWWGIWLFIMPITSAWITIISPVMITFLLLKVSGVPMLEGRKAKSAEYQKYINSTPAVFPFQIRSRKRVKPQF